MKNNVKGLLFTIFQNFKLLFGTPLFTIIFFLQSSSNIVGQQFKFAGSVQENLAQIPVPFAHLIFNDTLHQLTDIDGKFEITLNFIPKKISITRPDFRTCVLYPPFDSLTILLNRFQFFNATPNSGESANAIMQNVCTYKNVNTFLNKSFVYHVYNKYTITSRQNVKANNIINQLSGKLPFKINTLNTNQHLLIAESYSIKKYVNEIHRKEELIGVKSSNVSIPSLFIKTTAAQNFFLYNNTISYQGIDFLSPLDPDFNKLYSFELVEKFKIDKDSLALIKFFPIAKNKLVCLQGYLHINLSNFAVQHYLVSPALSETEIYFMGTDYPVNSEWIPKRKVTLTIYRKGIQQINMMTLSNLTFMNFKSSKSILSKSEFDEIVWEYPDKADQKLSEFWDSVRPSPLNTTDSNTYKYYDSWDNRKVVQRLFSIGENLNLGFIPLHKISIETKTFVNFNEVEGIRLGIGGYTNQKFSKVHTIGGFAGYGFLDQRWKYGVNHHCLLSLNKNIWNHFSFSRDLQESGNSTFYFDRYQYPTEILRKYRLRILDNVTQFENSVSAHPFKWTDIGVGISHNKHSTDYSYSYENSSPRFFDFTELKIGARIGYGEPEILFQNHRRSLPSKFPIVYIQFTKSIYGLGGKFDFNKFDLKIEQQFKIKGIGSTSIQAIGGIVSGNAPYMKLYNMKGSYKSPSVVVRNSFETMRYNEFLSDTYLAFFIIHNFGRIYVNHPNIQPTILLLHNFGFGSLKNSLSHSSLPFKFKTLENGYIETGSFADNLLVFKLAGLKTGLGVGFFYRYGKNASVKASENFVFKFSLNFGF